MACAGGVPAAAAGGSGPPGRAQRRHKPPAGLVAVLGHLGQGFGEDRVDGLRQIRAQLGQCRRRIVLVRPQQRHVVIAPERRRPRQHLEQDAGQAVDVAAAVHRAAGDLLGRHIVERADELADAGEPGQRQGLLRQPEVGEIGVLGAVAVGALGDEDVARFDVPVHQVVRMGGVQRGGDLEGDPAGGLQRQRSVAVEQRPQIPPPDVAHRDVEHAVGLPGLEDRHDVRVVDRRGHPRFMGEAPAEGVVPGELGRQQLHRHGTAEPQIFRAVDHRHPAPADLVLEQVLGDPAPAQP